MPGGLEQNFVLGQPSPALLLTSAAQVERVISDIFSQAEHRIDVRAVRLEHKFFTSEKLTQAVTALITRNLRNQIRFIVDDTFHFKNSQSRIIHLARSYSSYVKVHKMLDQQSVDIEFFIVADQVCFVQQTASNKYPARAASYAPGQSKILRQKFTDCWNKSEQIAELFTPGLS